MRNPGIDLERVALKERRTRILATIGPASEAPETLADLVDLGVDVFRLNFSHGDHASHRRLYEGVRAAAAAAGRHVAILADLCGPKIRVGRFEGGEIELVTGETVTVTVAAVTGRAGLIPSEYGALASDARAGDRILLDDGRLELRVTAIAGEELQCEVRHGGALRDRKGMNLPGVAVSAPALTEKDRADARFAADLGVDFVALSFVRQAADVDELREFLRRGGHELPIVAKIEKPEAVDRIAEILIAADAIMIARGDLGVEMPAEEVPLIQQELIRLASLANRPVIVATQMLESMIDNPRPTRAEVADVAAAASAGADAVMLSGETASGSYPREAVATMDRVLRMIEGYQWRHGQFGRLGHRDGTPDDGLDADALLTEALSRATAQLSRDLSVHAITVPTFSGRTARMVSAQRPAAPIVAMAVDASLCRQLALCWGICAHLVSDANELRRNPQQMARSVVTDRELAGPGDHVLLVWDTSSQSEVEATTISVLRV